MIQNLLINSINLFVIISAVFLAVLFTEKRVLNKYFSLLLISTAFIMIIFSFKYTEAFDFTRKIPAYSFASFIFLISIPLLLYASIRSAKKSPFVKADLKKLLLLLVLLPAIACKARGIRVPSTIAECPFESAARIFYLVWVNMEALSTGAFLIIAVAMCAHQLLTANGIKEKKGAFELSLQKRLFFYIAPVYSGAIVIDLLNPLLTAKTLSSMVSLVIFVFLLLIIAHTPGLLNNTRIKYKKSALSNDDAAKIVAQLRDSLAGERLYRDSKLSQPRLAQITGIPVNTMSQAINQELKLNFNALINSYRIDEARQLLLASDMKVIEIAYATGFETLSRFNTVFKQTTGMTPSEYRRSVSHKDAAGETDSH